MFDFPPNQFVPLDAFMAQCNAHYYGASEAIGGAGDFITAPEISQMFGELIGAWAVARWQTLGRPAPFQLIELGPGKGTLMSDVMRVMRQNPDCYRAVEIHLVETSPKLRAAQGEMLAKFSPPVSWHDDIREIPSAPFILLANEFFDALAIRQFVFTATGWHERGVTFDGKKFAWASREIAGTELPQAARHLPPPVPGNMIEICPALPEILETIRTRFILHAGAALIIDYGYAATDYGDTFQALRAHEYADPLEYPGEQDLTAHVNFSVIENFAKEQIDAHVLQTSGPLGQGEFLMNLGLQLRGEKIIAGAAEPAEKLEIIEAAHRLTHPAEMGTLFKVMCLSSPHLPEPEGFHASQRRPD